MEVIEELHSACLKSQVALLNCSYIHKTKHLNALYSIFSVHFGLPELLPYEMFSLERVCGAGSLRLRIL